MTKLEAFLVKLDADLEATLERFRNDSRTFDLDLTAFVCETCGVKAVNNYGGQCATCFTS